MWTCSRTRSRPSRCSWGTWTTSTCAGRSSTRPACSTGRWRSATRSRCRRARGWGLPRAARPVCRAAGRRPRVCSPASFWCRHPGARGTRALARPRGAREGPDGARPARAEHHGAGAPARGGAVHRGHQRAVRVHHRAAGAARPRAAPSARAALRCCRGWRTPAPFRGAEVPCACAEARTCRAAFSALVSLTYARVYNFPSC